MKFESLLQSFRRDPENLETAKRLLLAATRLNHKIPEEALALIQSLSHEISDEDADEDDNLDDLFLRYAEKVEGWYSFARIEDELGVFPSRPRPLDIHFPDPDAIIELGSITGYGYSPESYFSIRAQLIDRLAHNKQKDAWIEMNLDRARRYHLVPSAAPRSLIMEQIQISSGNEAGDIRGILGAYFRWAEFPGRPFSFIELQHNILNKELPMTPRTQAEVDSFYKILKAVAESALPLGWASLIQTPHLEDDGKLEYAKAYMVPYRVLGLSTDYPVDLRGKDVELLADHWALGSDYRTLTDTQFRQGTYPTKIILVKRARQGDYVTWMQVYAYDGEQRQYQDKGHYDMNRQQGYTNYVMRLLQLSVPRGFLSRDYNTYELVF